MGMYLPHVLVIRLTKTRLNTRCKQGLRYILREEGKRLQVSSDVCVSVCLIVFTCIFMRNTGLIHDLLRSSATIVLLSRVVNRRFPQGYTAINFPGWNRPVKWQITSDLWLCWTVCKKESICVSISLFGLCSLETKPLKAFISHCETCTQDHSNKERTKLFLLCSACEFIWGLYQNTPHNVKPQNCVFCVWIYFLTSLPVIVKI